MIDPKKIYIDNFTYDLPHEKIAKFPLKQRDKSKLLIYDKKSIKKSIFFKISDFIPDKSLLILNDTKVIQARLIFYKKTGAKIEIFCLEPVSTTNIQINGSSVWKCLIGNSKKWKAEKLVNSFNYKDKKYTLSAKKVEKKTNAYLIEFQWQPEDINFSEVLNISGLVPLPPYLNREPVESDKIQYQTIYAKNNGSVAAPTAGFHFTKNVFQNLKKKNITCKYITLNVGAGTFKPVKSKTIEEHKMHTEKFSFNKNILIKIIQQSESENKIISVGTTTLRTLESIYWLGVKLIVDKDITDFSITQWLPYKKKYDKGISLKNSFYEIIKFMDRHSLNTLSCSTQLLIVPGYKFHIADGIITNFHQPKSTLLLLIASILGDSWKKVYNYALSNNFRFLSYGDSCLFYNTLNKHFN